MPAAPKRYRRAIALNYERLLFSEEKLGHEFQCRTTRACPGCILCCGTLTPTLSFWFKKFVALAVATHLPYCFFFFFGFPASAVLSLADEGSPCGGFCQGLGF